jgi:hypothetical protein
MAGARRSLSRLRKLHDGLPDLLLLQQPRPD